MKNPTLTKSNLSFIPLELEVTIFANETYKFKLIDGREVNIRIIRK